ncbi:MAG TPA: histidinol-phosphate transaminase [Opitutae bacterium]|nr:histidinol-phosphate transaminase [Opitutaceae bacterium]HCR30956.1 histidinol-phosphate transaminase [Opitutae bacterium]
MKSKKTVAGLALENIQLLSAYRPGFQPDSDDWVKLNTNESPYPPSPQVSQAIQEIDGADLRLYPNPVSADLREAIGDLHGLGSENVIVGNGSDDILNMLVRAFSKNDKPATLVNPSYSLYPVLCGIQDTGVIEVPFDRSMEIPLGSISNIDASILFLTSPNAPTGVGFGNDVLRQLAESFEGIVVIDEAYADFAKANAVELLAEFPNIVITRSLSKSYALAGLRVGYGLAEKGLIDILDRVRDSYNVNRLSQVGALAAIKDQNYLTAIVGKIKRTRDFYRQEFQALGWFVYDSQANFLFLEPVNRNGEKGPHVAKALFDFLKENRILGRYFPAHALTEGFLRISVGDEDQMLKLSETVEQWLKTE